MCGIAGILALADGRPAERAELVHMIGTLHHRGPDGFGYYQDGPIGLAHPPHDHRSVGWRSADRERGSQRVDRSATGCC